MAVLLLLPVIPGSAQILKSQLHVPFVGPDRAHVVFEIDAGNVVDLRLMHEPPSEAATPLRTSGSGTMSGALALQDLAPGLHRLHFICRYQKADEDGNVLILTETTPSVPFTIEPQLQGAPIFNEAITVTGGLTTPPYKFVVPAGITLTLSGGPITADRLEVAGTLIATGCFDLALTVFGPGFTQVADSRVLAFHGSGGDARFERCLIERGLDTEGDQASLDLDNCLVAGSVFLDHAGTFVARHCDFPRRVEIDTRRTTAALLDCSLSGILDLIASGTPVNAPELSGNSFLARLPIVIRTPEGATEPFDKVKLRLANNYWGSVEGPRYPGSPGVSGWIAPRGGTCAYYDSNDGFRKTGSDRQASVSWPRPLPAVSVADFRCGQNVLGPPEYGADSQTLRVPARSGRPTLVCFDVSTTANAIQPGWSLLCNGRQLTPLGGVFTARRDYGAVSRAADNGRRTLNFIIPAEAAVGTLQLELWMDPSSLAGYEPRPGPTRIWGPMAVPLHPGFARPYRVGVAAVELDVPGWSTGKPSRAGVTKVFEAVSRDLVTLWPFEPGEAEVIPVGPLPIARNAVNGNLQSSPRGLYLAHFLSVDVHNYLISYNALNWDAKLDVIVAVLPVNSISGGAEGVVGIMKSGAFVDEINPEAAIHELGHTLGLYPSEQYGVWTRRYDEDGNPVFPKRGAVLQNGVLFNPSHPRSPYHPQISTLRHLPRLASLSLPYDAIYDFMGAAKPLWIAPGSLRMVYGGLSSLLSTPGPALQAPPAPANPAPGSRQMLFTSSLRRVQEAATGATTYRLVTADFQCRDVTAEGHRPHAGTFRALQSIRAYDANGSPTGDPIPIQTDVPAIDPPPDLLPWIQIATVPEAAHRLVLYEPELDIELPLITDDGVPFSVDLAADLAPGPIPDQLELTWTVDSPGKPLPVSTQLAYSTDGGATWVPVGLPTTRFAATIGIESLPAASDLTWRAVASDGFRSAEGRLRGFRVDNRPPVVGILTPQPGDIAAPDHVWDLTASAFDPERGTLFAGTWVSSRDGVLGETPMVSGVRLSQGPHTLTFSASDDEGLIASASVEVLVGSQEAQAADLGIDDSALTIRQSGADPIAANPARLQRDAQAELQVAVRNAGYTNAAILSLYLQAGDAKEALLASAVLEDWLPFETRSVAASRVMEQVGEYRVRATLTSTRLADPNPANNSRTWTFANQAPTALPLRVSLVRHAAHSFELEGLDPDGDALTPRLIELPQLGSLERTGSRFTYTALNPGEDQLVFTVSDGRQESPPATIHFDVADGGGAPEPVPPCMVGPDRFVARVGQAFEQAVQVSAGPAVTFSAVGLPAWLDLAPATGWLTGTPPASGDFRFTVLATSNAGTAGQAIALHVGEEFARWIAGHGLAGDPAAPGADPDLDRLPNIAEFAYGLPPGSPDPGPALRLAMEDVQAAGSTQVDRFLHLTYRQRIGGEGTPGIDYRVDGLRYRLEFNEAVADPAGWQGGPSLFQFLPYRVRDNGDGTESVTIRCLNATGNQSAAFLRLRVSTE